MKFKNYINSHTGDNRIYSLNDITQMPLGDVLKNKEELLSQYRVLGVPTESELQNSDNVVYVKAYTREDGTGVRAHWRSKPDGIENNNLSSRKNSYDTSSGTPTGGASEIEDTDDIDYLDYTVDEPVVDVSTPEKVQKLMYPDEIAGVKRGEEMSFEEVARKGVNPTYEKYIEKGLDDGNCHCCTLAYELCRRGYSVNAASVFENETAKKLSHNAFDLWIDPRNGRRCDWQEIDIENETSFNYLEKNIKQGERYELGMYPQLIEDDFDTVDGHVVSVERGSDDQLRIYDPQRREYYIGNEQVKLYLYSWIDAPEAVKGIYPKLLRVDDKIINPEYYRTVF